MASAKIFSHLDLTRGFYQIKMHEDSRSLSAFTTHEGLYEWNVMSFGLVNSTATFVKMINIVLHKQKYIRHYVDDICVFTNDWETHLSALEKLLGLLKSNNLTVSPEKIKIGFYKLDFLGYTIGNNEIKPTQDLAKKIFNIDTPKNKKDVRAIIGLCNFYRQFIQNFSIMIKPLIELTKKNSPTKIIWTDECKQTMEKIKGIFKMEPILVPIDFHKEIIVATDASLNGLGACMLQSHNGINRPVLYLSRSLSKAEANYSIFELECLAIL